MSYKLDQTDHLAMLEDEPPEPGEYVYTDYDIQASIDSAAAYAEEMLNQEDPSIYDEQDEPDPEAEYYYYDVDYIFQDTKNCLELTSHCSNRVNRHGINSMVQEEDKKRFYQQLKSRNLTSYADKIYHCVPECPHPYFTIRVSEHSYEHYQYFVGYTCIPDKFCDIGFNTVISGFALKSDLTYHRADDMCKIPYYRVRKHDKIRFKRDINQLFNILEREHKEIMDFIDST